MSFTSFSDFISMGHHARYVWPAYCICLAVLVLNVVLPIVARRRYLQQVARHLHRERLK